MSKGERPEGRSLFQSVDGKETTEGARYRERVVLSLLGIFQEALSYGVSLTDLAFIVNRVSHTLVDSLPALRDASETKAIKKRLTGP